MGVGLRCRRLHGTFALRTTRAATVLQEPLTDTFDGVVNYDRPKMYGNQGRLQWDWDQPETHRNVRAAAPSSRTVVDVPGCCRSRTNKIRERAMRSSVALLNLSFGRENAKVGPFAGQTLTRVERCHRRSLPQFRMHPRRTRNRLLPSTTAVTTCRGWVGNVSARWSVWTVVSSDNTFILYQS